MNCKPGDLAVIIVPGPYYGNLVSVLHAAPLSDFRLPDGHSHEGTGPCRWVIESLGKPFNAPIVAFGQVVDRRETRYGVARDEQLRPIRPGDVTEEEVSELYRPAPKVPEHA